MRLFLLLLFGVQVAATALGQGAPALYPVYIKGRWGYIDSTGALIIAPRYRVAAAFSEGLAPVRQDGNYGYIDSRGRFVIGAR